MHRLASRVLCATLAIPIPPSRNQIDQVLEMDESTADKQRRLALLLGLQNPPSRQQMVKDLVCRNRAELWVVKHWWLEEFAAC